MKKSLLILCAAVAALVGCTKQAATFEPDQASPVKFKVEGINTYTVKTPIADGEFVSVFAGSPINKSNVKATVSGTSLAGAEIYWGVESHTADFWAVYPYMGISSAPFRYDLTDYDYAKDVLTAHADAVAWKEAVALNFTHPFVKLTFVVENKIADDAVSTIAVSGVAMAGMLNAKTGEITDLEAPRAIADGEYTLSNEGKVYTYTTLIMPQAVKPLVTVTMYSGAEYTYTLNDNYTFEAGKAYTANVDITGDSHSGSSTPKTAVALSFTTTDWAPVTVTAPGTQGGSTTEKWWYIEGTLSDKGWEVHVPMACTGPNTWEADINYTPSVDVNPGIKFRYVADPSSSDWVVNFGKDITIAEYNTEAGENFGKAWDTDHAYYPTLEQDGGNVKLGDAGNYHIFWYSDTHTTLVVKK